jgi:hypothetical protein
MRSCSLILGVNLAAYKAGTMPPCTTSVRGFRHGIPPLILPARADRPYVAVPEALGAVVRGRGAHALGLRERAGVCRTRNATGTRRAGEAFSRSDGSVARDFMDSVELAQDGKSRFAPSSTVWEKVQLSLTAMTSRSGQISRRMVRCLG